MRSTIGKPLAAREVEDVFGDILAVGFSSNRYSGSPVSRKIGTAGSSRCSNMRWSKLSSIHWLTTRIDVGKVEHHAAVVELGCFDGDDGPTVVAVQILALAVVVEQPMAVAEINLACDAKHADGTSSFKRKNCGAGDSLRSRFYSEAA